MIKVTRRDLGKLAAGVLVGNHTGPMLTRAQPDKTRSPARRHLRTPVAINKGAAR